MDVVHPDGSITLEGRLVFTGSVGTRTGTLLVTYNGIGNINTGHENLRGVGRQGTLGLAGLHTEITLEGNVGAPVQDAPLRRRALIPDRFCLRLSRRSKKRSSQSAVTRHRVAVGVLSSVVS